MRKLLVFAFVMTAVCSVAQNNDQALGNGFYTNIAPQVQSSDNNNDGPQQFAQTNFNPAVNTDNNATLSNITTLDNNPGIEQQQAFSNVTPQVQSKASGMAINMPKLAMKPSSGSASSSSSRSGAHKQIKVFSKKVKRIKRKMNYVLSKKGKRSFVVDNCFAWAK